MLRARNGANIELFEYQAPNGDKLQPFGDDAGATHIAFYVIDLPGSVAALRAKGVPVLGDPIVMTDGPTAGETWVYFLTPWGSKIELVSYQNGMRYERSSPATRLWSPGVASQVLQSDKKDDDRGIVDDLVKKYLNAWSEPDERKRERAISEIYTEEVELVDPSAIVSGRTELNRFISGLRRQFPGYRFSLGGKVDTHHGVARITWHFGPPVKPDAVVGQDLIRVRDGRIASNNIFFGAAAH